MHRNWKIGSSRENTPGKKTIVDSNHSNYQEFPSPKSNNLQLVTFYNDKQHQSCNPTSRYNQYPESEEFAP